MNEGVRPVAVNGRKALTMRWSSPWQPACPSPPLPKEPASPSEPPTAGCTIPPSAAALRKPARLFAEAVGRLASLAGKAVDTLGDLLASASDMVKLHAAKSVLELGPKLREAGEIAERLDALERQAAELAKGTHQPADETEAEDAVDEAPPEANVGANI
jgi:hypothetical protein